MIGLVGRLLHAAVNLLQKLRRLVSLGRPPATGGVHAIALTPHGEFILVNLSYARGWRLPGGGRKAGETPDVAILRELREEIGMFSHGTVERITDFRYRSDDRRDNFDLFIVRDVLYRPKWSLEVRRVAAFPPSEPPAELARLARRLLIHAGLI
jgi:8-oxo-dGTP pyrophosphatase MutT (NUDIX family)